MKLQEHKIDNKKIIHIYLNEQEKQDKVLQEKIKHISESNKVVLFVSGDNEPERVLKEMVKIIQNDLIENKLLVKEMK